MPRTNWKEMANYEVTIPPAHLAEAFNRVIRSLVNQIIDGIHESHSLNQLRDTLLPKLISGEIRIRNAEKLVEDVT